MLFAPHLEAEGNEPGSRNSYWRFSTKALTNMLIYAGFSQVEPQGKHVLSGPKGNRIPITAVVARV